MSKFYFNNIFHSISPVHNRHSHRAYDNNAYPAVPGSRLNPRLDRLRTVCHLGNLLQNNRIVYRFMRIFAPRKRAVVLAQYSRHCRRIFAQPCKFTDDQKARVLLVSLLDLLRVQTSETGNFPVKNSPRGSCRNRGCCVRPEPSW